MTWRIEFAPRAEQDFDLIFDHLFDTYRGIGEPRDTAFDNAVRRIESIRRRAEMIAQAPFQGTLHNAIAPGLRHVTHDRAIYWFDLDEDAQVVRILAVFFGGQDHVRQMLRRSLE